jgi:dTDP-4-amino-4,6-dideoxygalactose transaminase
MIHVTKTYLPERESLQKYIDQIYASGWLTNNGALVQQLENELKEFLNVEYLILTVNGTCALQLAYKLLGLKGEIITTPFTFVATVSSLVWEGLDPVFADIDENTLNMDPANIGEKISDKTTAILPVHVFGNPCDVQTIQQIAGNHGLKVVYDAAHAFDVHLGSRNISEFGDIAAYSFHSTKIFHTIEGGAVVVRSKELYDKALLMRNFGIPGYDRITELGVNFKMNEFQAAMGLGVLHDYRQIAERRKQVSIHYTNAFISQKNLKLQHIPENVQHNYAYFPVIFSDETKLLLTKEKLNEQGIYPRRYFYPSLNELPYLKGKKQHTPVAESISRRILCLPLYYDLETAVQNKIVDIVNKYA